MASDIIKELGDSSFQNEIANPSTPVVVDFWAPWCGPCKALTPILEELSKELEGKVVICKLNVDEHAAIAGKFQVRAIPTIGIFKEGKLVDQVVGLATKNDLKAKIESHV